MSWVKHSFKFLFLFLRLSYSSSRNYWLIPPFFLLLLSWVWHKRVLTKCKEDEIHICRIASWRALYFCNFIPHDMKKTVWWWEKNAHQHQFVCPQHWLKPYIYIYLNSKSRHFLRCPHWEPIQTEAHYYCGKSCCPYITLVLLQQEESRWWWWRGLWWWWGGGLHQGDEEGDEKVPRVVKRVTGRPMKTLAVLLLLCCFCSCSQSSLASSYEGKKIENLNTHTWWYFRFIF